MESSPVRSKREAANISSRITRNENQMIPPKPDGFVSSVTSLLPDLEALYKDVHSHPELSLQETRTSSIAAGRLRAAGSR